MNFSCLSSENCGFVIDMFSGNHAFKWRIVGEYEVVEGKRKNTDNFLFSQRCGVGESCLTQKTGSFNVCRKRLSTHPDPAEPSLTASR